jgi:hypothetical protein
MFTILILNSQLTFNCGHFSYFWTRIFPFNHSMMFFATRVLVSASFVSFVWTGPRKRELSPCFTNRELRFACKTRTESVFYKSRTAICKRRTHPIPSLATKRMNGRIKTLSILMTKFNVFTEKVTKVRSCKERL